MPPAGQIDAVAVPFIINTVATAKIVTGRDQRAIGLRCDVVGFRLPRALKVFDVA